MKYSKWKWLTMCFWIQHDTAPWQTPEGFIAGKKYGQKCRRCGKEFW